MPAIRWCLFFLYLWRWFVVGWFGLFPRFVALVREWTKPKGPPNPNEDRLMLATFPAKGLKCGEGTLLQTVDLSERGTIPSFPWKTLNAKSKLKSSSNIGPLIPFYFKSGGKLYWIELLGDSIQFTVQKNTTYRHSSQWNLSWRKGKARGFVDVLKKWTSLKLLSRSAFKSAVFHSFQEVHRSILSRKLAHREKRETQLKIIEKKTLANFFFF